jgi:bacterioferritin-associated ferredoxin
MIVCHCNRISRDELEVSIRALLARDPHRVLTPGLVYKQLGKTARCCGCFPLTTKLLVEIVERIRAEEGEGAPVSFESFQKEASPAAPNVVVFPAPRQRRTA